jgi:DNA-binding MarR family transcriptional regulator
MPLSPRHHIIIFLFKHPNVTHSTLERGLEGTIAKQTISKHLTGLMDEELVWKGFIKTDRKHPRYFLTDKGVKELENFHNDQKFDDQIDKMTLDEAKQTLKDIIHGSIL